MNGNNESELRALIRLIPPARTLREQLERSLHLETYAGTGDLAVRSFQGLQSSVLQITNDPYVATLTLEVPAETGDREKVSMALLAVSQLQSYMEGQAGVPSNSGGGGAVNIQRGVIQLNDVAGLPSEAFTRLMDIAGEEAKGK